MKIKKLFIKYVNWILASLISMLGFAGCYRIFESPKEYGPPPAPEYGTPHADYTVKGAVVNKATGGPITGIRVGYYPQEWDEDVFGPPSVYYGSKAYVITDTMGEFKLTATSFPNSNNKLPVYVEDIDGEENGLFQPKMAEVDFSNAVHSGNPGHWYEGEYTVTTTIQLTEVKVE